MSARLTFDSSEYHAALKAWDSIHCVECGAALIPREQRNPRPHPRSVLAKCCNATCEKAFIERTVLDWSKIRDKALARDNWTCQDCGRNSESTTVIFRFARRSNLRLSRLSYQKAKFWWKFMGRFEESIPLELEVHHIIPISEGGPEFDLDNLVTLCYDCHHLGRHGSKAPTPEEVAQKRGEERQKAEQERLQAIRARHTCLDCFSEVA